MATDGIKDRESEPEIEPAEELQDEDEVAENELAEEPQTKRKHARTEKRKIRYAVVGLGYIAQIAILPAFAHAKENSELVALVSSDPDKIKALSQKYKVRNTYSYEEYADCLASGEIDAVYITLPNHMHRAYAEAAAQKGIHVLCEKPLAVDEIECQAIIDAARDGNVKLMTAYRLHFEQGNLTSMQSIREGKIGEPRIFRSAFCQQVEKGNSRLRGEDHAGPLEDMGIYCINAARYLFSSEPTEVFARAESGSDERFREVPEMWAATMMFPDHRLATFTCSFGAADESSYEVIGTKGVLKMDPAYEMATDLKGELVIDDKTKNSTYKKRDQFGPEIVYFSNCILENREPEPNGAEGLADVRITQALIESSKKNQPVKVSASFDGRRPSPEQEISLPAVKPPQLVRAASPSGA